MSRFNVDRTALEERLFERITPSVYALSHVTPIHADAINELTGIKDRYGLTHDHEDNAAMILDFAHGHEEIASSLQAQRLQGFVGNKFGLKVLPVFFESMRGYIMVEDNMIPNKMKAPFVYQGKYDESVISRSGAPKITTGIDPRNIQGHNFSSFTGTNIDLLARLSEIFSMDNFGAQDLIDTGMFNIGRLFRDQYKKLVAAGAISISDTSSGRLYSLTDIAIRMLDEMRIMGTS